MAPRKAKEEPLDEDHVESKRLTERAMELGVSAAEGPRRCLPLPQGGGKPARLPAAPSRQLPATIITALLPPPRGMYSQVLSRTRCLSSTILPPTKRELAAAATLAGDLLPLCCCPCTATPVHVSERSAMHPQSAALCRPGPCCSPPPRIHLLFFGPPCAATVMLRADGKDIVKKGSSRKGRYLLVFNFQLAPAAAGKLVRGPGRGWHCTGAGGLPGGRLPPWHLPCCAAACSHGPKQRTPRCWYSGAARPAVPPTWQDSSTWRHAWALCHAVTTCVCPLPAIPSPPAARRLRLQGTLTRLDSPNPVMYLDFPQGRYKMFGEGGAGLGQGAEQAGVT